MLTRRHILVGDVKRKAKEKFTSVKMLRIVTIIFISSAIIYPMAACPPSSNSPSWRDSGAGYTLPTVGNTVIMWDVLWTWCDDDRYLIKETSDERKSCGCESLTRAQTGAITKRSRRYVYLAKCLFMTSLRMKAFGLNDSWYDGVLTVMIFAVNETKCEIVSMKFITEATIIVLNLIISTMLCIPNPSACVAFYNLF
ncbi:hypothetical protein CK203_073285 [Vitis vinifera]|uniref:Uncharacterized protein n=1 Tax=Vitis vinifera TaxID=29760 RepID=A0A438ENN6_VITVI|nr:hypothetical protein CK203_073285 [Vitis vinifera]